MDELKLIALDEEDLKIISAHVQDAVFKPVGIEYLPRLATFALVLNRFVWEKAGETKKTGRAKGYERRRTVLSFRRVLSVRSIGFARGDEETVLSLLALRFTPTGEGPEGTIELTLAGDATIALQVECIEVQLADTGGAWETAFRPRHPQD
ncbi:DUF2948 family protein [Rhizobium sp. YIM 134829]|uniref:DUF2948 family protein n=1 Tax=Rhizobium sp. YIM 134829 TaxID=3390453 RepID=UPI00397B5C2D